MKYLALVSQELASCLLSLTSSSKTPMAATNKKLIFLIGATGAQGMPIAKELLKPQDDGSPSPYAIRALTRNPEHRRAIELKELGVELVKGTFMRTT